MLPTPWIMVKIVCLGWSGVLVFCHKSHLEPDSISSVWVSSDQNTFFLHDLWLTASMTSFFYCCSFIKQTIISCPLNVLFHLCCGSLQPLQWPLIPRLVLWLMLSLLFQTFSLCRRQCLGRFVLVSISENILTFEGKLWHWSLFLGIGVKGTECISHAMKYFLYHFTIMKSLKEINTLVKLSKTIKPVLFNVVIV